jgi:hypothetical protein
VPPNAPTNINKAVVQLKYGSRRGHGGFLPETMSWDDKLANRLKPKLLVRVRHLQDGDALRHVTDCERAGWEGTSAKTGERDV